MAIIIPSKQIYKVDNPKVIENALKTIEFVNQNNEIVLENNINPISQNLILQDEIMVSDQKEERVKPTTTYGSGLVVLSAIRTDALWANATISLPRKYQNQSFKDNFYITQIEPTIVAEFDLIISNTNAKGYIGVITGRENYIDFEPDSYAVLNYRESFARNYQYADLITNYNYKTDFKTENSLTITPDKISCQYSILSTVEDVKEEDKVVSLSILSTNINNGTSTYPYIISKHQNNDTYILNVSMIKNFTVWIGNIYSSENVVGQTLGFPITAQKYEFKLKSAKIIYNETVRRIATSESTMSLLSTTTNGDNTFSIDGNQFIRSETQYNGVEGATATLYTKTLTDYEKGKETANLRCSIGEYYDDNGDKVISTETADKMLFDVYDEVIPMLLNSWGEDEPISYNEQGLAKTFKVVGVKPIADGAAWQDLTLREFGAMAIKIKLPKPVLTLNGKLLTIYDKSGKAESFDIYANGAFVTNTTQNSLNLDTLDLKGGTQRICAIAKATNYKNSDKSRYITFIVRYTTFYTEENESGGLTYIILSNDYWAENGEYNIGGVL